jgi:hypothetical protein
LDPVRGQDKIVKWNLNGYGRFGHLDDNRAIQNLPFTDPSPDD